MVISSAVPTTAYRANQATTTQQQPPEPQDEYTPVANFLRSVNPYVAGAIMDVGTVSAPMVGAHVGGFPGLAAGVGGAYAFNYSIDKNPRRALGAVLWPGILGGILATQGNPPSLLTTGLLVGMGAAMGALAVWRNQIEEELKNQASGA